MDADANRARGLEHQAELGCDRDRLGDRWSGDGLSAGLPQLNLKLFSSAQNNFRFISGKFREKPGKTQKSKFLFDRTNMEMSHIYYAVRLLSIINFVNYSNLKLEK